MVRARDVAWNPPPVALELPEGTRIEQAGAFVAVQYRHRKTLDLYLAINGAPGVHCGRCDSDIPWDPDAFVEHVRSHDARRRRRKGNTHG